MNSFILIALGWLKDNVKHLGFPLAVLFCGLWLRGCGALADCQDKLAVVPVKVEAAQGATQTAKASVRVQIVYRDREVPAGDAVTPSWKPLPCPDVQIEADSSTEDTHWQSASVVPLGSATSHSEPTQALFAGIGYLESPYLELGYAYKSFRINGKMNTNQSIGGGLTWDAFRW